MSDTTNDARQERVRLLEANVTAVDAEVAAAIARGLAMRDVVAVVADLREALARPFVEGAAERHGVTAEALMDRIATPFGRASRTSTCAIARQVAIGIFEMSYPQLSQALAQFPLPDRVWVVVIAAGTAALVSRAPRLPAADQ